MLHKILQKLIKYKITNNHKSEQSWKDSSKNTLYVYYKKSKKDKILVGKLKYKNKIFTFNYEPKYKGMIEGLDDSYKNEYLHPFFQSRIPNKSRPNVSEKYKKYDKDPLLLLGHLGRESALSKFIFSLNLT